ncbi:rRNA large subunit methyltransferase [Williamsoniiplasma somnilux]|uniref:rRNA large subunit methyltransferase n=2 Tax=Williamsoniiplasma somnilux TaxID=215578 RepID=A0A2K8NYD7_9MOLU|nr:rRNA large subunit methyltransferase [Williamsoniiplasma somnilux]
MDAKYFEEASENYLKWLSKFCDLEIIQLKEEFHADFEKNKSINCEILEKKILANKEFETVILNVSSTYKSSEEFSEIISKNKNFKSGKLQFVIGPSDGFTNEFKNKYQGISFGPITLPHQLFRVVLLEQIYRAFKINNNEKYHK